MSHFDYPLWRAVARKLRMLIRPGELLLAPNEFLELFPQTIAQHVKKRMLAGTTIHHYAIHKGRLPHTDPEVLAEAVACPAVFANEEFVLLSRSGLWTPPSRRHHVAQLRTYLAGVPREPEPETTGIVVTTYRRPEMLHRSLQTLVRQGCPILVVDDGSPEPMQSEARAIAQAAGAEFIALRRNLGVAAAINIGVSYWLARLDIGWISAFNDDVEVADGALAAVANVARQSPWPREHAIYTGYSAQDRPGRTAATIGGVPVFLDLAAAGVHLHAHRSYWQGVLPVPTAYPAAPKKTGGVFPGQGSDEDWWIGTWSPNAAPKRGGRIVTVPGLVREIAANGAESTWGNEVH